MVTKEVPTFRWMNLFVFWVVGVLASILRQKNGLKMLSSKRDAKSWPFIRLENHLKIKTKQKNRFFIKFQMWRYSLYFLSESVRIQTCLHCLGTSYGLWVMTKHHWNGIFSATIMVFCPEVFAEKLFWDKFRNDALFAETTVSTPELLSFTLHSFHTSQIFKYFLIFIAFLHFTLFDTPNFLEFYKIHTFYIFFTRHSLFHSINPFFYVLVVFSNFWTRLSQ